MTKATDKNKFTRIADITAVGFLLYLVGTGIGLWQGHTASVDDVTAALFGGPAALVVGLLIYFLVLKQEVTFIDSAWIFSGAAISGIVTAELLKLVSHGDAGWFSLFVTPLAAFIIALVKSRRVAQDAKVDGGSV